MAPKVEFLEENLQVLNFASIAQQILFKQPKPELRNRRAAQSTRFSWFMESGRHKDDCDHLVAENERIENENMDLREEIETLRNTIQRMTSEHAKQEQMLRIKLVEEREVQMKTACEKWQKRIEFVEKKTKMRIEELENQVARLREQLHRKSSQAETINVDEEDSDDEDDEVGGDGSYDAASSSLDDVENRSINGESFEKKRCLNSSYQ